MGKKMAEIRLFSLRNEKGKRQHMEETVIKYIYSTARIIFLPIHGGQDKK